MFGERLARLLETAGQRGKLAVAVVDIDRFKTINDTLGRGAGDELLRQIAARLSADAAGIAARISGVQFSLATPVPEGARLGGQHGGGEPDAVVRRAVSCPRGGSQAHGEDRRRPLSRARHRDRTRCSRGRNRR